MHTGAAVQAVKKTTQSSCMLHRITSKQSIYSKHW
ncbi:hypothetical protein CSUI_010164 [Cystoisospora suis]|uniref:Uncharacterized protein n=1 Tax=Cystoisospora suis TaxID=483139 RepID=A0A2C6KHL8_9APIC|nr:hypothetical protein CSUI_010164 [Cystoisospora suis]